MTTGQSQEPEGIKSVSENGEEKNVSSPLSKKDISEQEFSSKQNEKLENDESFFSFIPDILPSEVLDKLPPSEHLTQIIENS